MAKKESTKRDIFTRAWITENAINICQRYSHGVLTLRALHYQLVSMEFGKQNIYPNFA